MTKDVTFGLLYIMVSGSPPFDGQSDKEIMVKI